MSKLYTKATIEKAADSDDFIAVASTSAVDRHGESVSPEGWDLKNFKKNPVLLWGHDHTEPAIGKATKVWIEGTGKGAKLMIKGKIHEYTEKARAIKAMVEDGIISTMSVGFKPIDMEDNTFLKQELLEVSFVNVPANPQAMISAIKSLEKADVSEDVLEEVFEQPNTELNELRNKVTELETVVKMQKPLAPTINPLGRTKQVQKARLSMLKVIARSADKMNESKQIPSQQRATLKTIKRATELLIVADKKELNG